MPAIVWFRRDLRVHDHPPLHAALAAHDAVVCLFVLDPALLRGRWASPGRTAFLLDCLAALDAELRARGGRLVLRTGRPQDVLPAVCAEAGATTVYAAGDASPYARARDRRLAALVDLRLGPGVFARRLGELPAPHVFTPWRRAWEAQAPRAELPAPDAISVPDAIEGEPLPTAADVPALLGDPAAVAPDLVDRPQPGERAALARLQAWLAPDGGARRYAHRRGVLADPTSRVSQDLHLGTLSALTAERAAAAVEGRGAAKWRTELAWRDFYAAVLVHNPHVTRGAYRPALDRLEWDVDPGRLEAWQHGRTGFPLVDAAMRQLLACGWMHNRGRMVVASFLTKDLHLDWRAGEAWFMRHLLDGDVGSNNGGWQWAAGTGTDPKGGGRILNPTLQRERFDPDGRFVARWVPEHGTAAYPEPIVDHLTERREAIARFKAVG